MQMLGMLGFFPIEAIKVAENGLILVLIIME